MKRRHFLTTASGAIAATTLTRCGTKDRPTLRICSWADYLSPELAAKFEKDNKCTLQIDTSDSNEAIYAKLTSGNGSYDLAIPSSYMVKKLVRENKLATLDHSKLRNLKHVDQAYLQRALDPAMTHSVPYMMACTCLAWHKSKVEDAVPSYAMLDRTDLKGRITLLDDMREVLGAALRSHGHSINSTDAAQLSQARDTAIRWKRNIARFDNKDYKNGIASGELDLVQGYTGDLLRIAEEDGDIEVRIPREGSAFSCDD
ncbi:MAG: spermidine/putrescine ABC transporter substrate-binding protein, partial [Verrucomicrobiaceae bacterium]